jgi:hypothetical protein
MITLLAVLMLIFSTWLSQVVAIPAEAFASVVAPPSSTEKIPEIRNRFEQVWDGMNPIPRYPALWTRCSRPSELFPSRFLPSRLRSAATARYCARIRPGSAALVCHTERGRRHGKIDPIC